jgi:polyferredoxin
MSKLKVTPCAGEGSGSCKRCSDNGKWNQSWMCFLYHIEGYEGCYCRDCVDAIQEEENQKEIEEIRKEYELAEKDTEMVEKSPRVYAYKNAGKRKELREKYVECLPKNKQIAVFLHSKLCHHNHTDYCGWYYEINGLDDDWSRSVHEEYLEKADKLLEVTGNTDMIKKIVEVIS